MFRAMASILLTTAFAVPLTAQGYNYAQALQMSIYFYEAQESGALSPGNRVPWRAASHMADGADVGRDLSGGWYDAGDHWKSNHTMAHAAAVLAWGAIEYPTAYLNSGQMDKFIAGLKYVNDYFLKCVVDPAPGDTTTYDGYELYIDVGGKPGPDPGLHSVWASPEVIEGYTVREAVKVTADLPGSDVASSMAAAMASSALVMGTHGGVEGRAYAQRLLAVALKLHLFADRYAEQFAAKAVTTAGVLAIAPDGSSRPIDYRDKAITDNIIWSALWMHRAFEMLDSTDYDGRFLVRALALQEAHVPYTTLYAWWKDLFIGQYNSALPVLFLQITDDERYAGMWHTRARDHIDHWNGLEPSPFGLKVRPEYSGSFSFKWVHAQTFLAMLYADMCGDSVLAESYRTYAREQVDYTLGDNAQGKSFVIGFGDKGWFNSPHHRGAHGVWKNFDHIIAERPEYNSTQARHVLYGALMGGPNADDEFTANIGDSRTNEVALDFNAGFQGVLAGLLARGYGSGSVLPDNSFPPLEARNSSTDLLTTDREFFVSAMLAHADESMVEIEATLFNRTRWPARVTDSLSFRCYFSADAAGALPTATFVGTNHGNLGPVVQENDTLFYVEVDFVGAPLRPFWVWNQSDIWTDHRTVRLRISADAGVLANLENDWSLAGIGSSHALLPRFPVFHRGELVGGELPGKEGPTLLQPRVRVSPKAVGSRLVPAYSLNGRVLSGSSIRNSAAPLVSSRLIIPLMKTIAR